MENTISTSDITRNLTALWKNFCSLTIAIFKLSCRDMCMNCVIYIADLITARLSVRLSVCHTPVFCGHCLTYPEFSYRRVAPPY